MNLFNISSFVGFLLVILARRNKSSKEVTNMSIKKEEILTGYFKIPRNIFEDEVYRRTNKGKACDAEIRGVLINENTEWTISISLGDVKKTEGNEKIPPYRYLDINLHGEKISLGLAYFSTKPIQQSEHELIVDCITWTDGEITVKLGQDYLVLTYELDADCQNDVNVVQGGNVTVTPLNSWYPYNEHTSKCGPNGWPQSICDHLADHLCGLKRADSDFCFRKVHEGNTCGLRMKIMSMTGIFRAKSLITTETPVKSVSGYHFTGLWHIGMVYPCLYDNDM